MVTHVVQRRVDTLTKKNGFLPSFAGMCFIPVLLLSLCIVQVVNIVSRSLILAPFPLFTASFTSCVGR